MCISHNNCQYEQNSPFQLGKQDSSNTLSNRVQQLHRHNFDTNYFFLYLSNSLIFFTFLSACIKSILCRNEQIFGQAPFLSAIRHDLLWTLTLLCGMITSLNIGFLVRLIVSMSNSAFSELTDDHVVSIDDTDSEILACLADTVWVRSMPGYTIVAEACLKSSSLVLLYDRCCIYE